MGKRLKGTLSIYFLLSMLLVLSVVFTLLESLRLYGAAYFSSQNPEAVAESVFAAYDADVYSKYHLFAYSAYSDEGLDMDRIYDAAEFVANTTLQPEADGRSFWLRQVLADSDVSEYELTTDDDGEWMYLQMAQCAKEELLEDVISGLDDVVDELGDDNADTLNGIERDANDAMSQGSLKVDNYQWKIYGSLPRIRTKGDNKEVDTESESYTEAAATYIEHGNPITSMSSLKSHGILDLVIQDRSGISEKTVVKSELAYERTLEKGNMQSMHKDGFSVTNKALVLRYIDKYFNSYVDNKAWGALDYEKEYLIFGKDSDEGNLKAAVNSLLLVREGCNYITLTKDPEKLAVATSLATAIGILFVIPEFIPVIKQGILLAWAYGESILDLRTLLCGGKVSLIKSPAEWTLDIDSMGSISGSYLKAQENSAGISYEMYLNAMLFMQQQKKQSQRLLNLIEANIRSMEGRNAFSIDKTVLSMELQLTYQSSPLFLMFVDEIEDKPENFSFIRIIRYSYIDDT